MARAPIRPPSQMRNIRYNLQSARQPRIKQSTTFLRNQRSADGSLQRLTRSQIEAMRPSRVKPQALNPNDFVSKRKPLRVASLELLNEVQEFHKGIKNADKAIKNAATPKSLAEREGISSAERVSEFKADTAGKAYSDYFEYELAMPRDIDGNIIQFDGRRPYISLGSEKLYVIVYAADVDDPSGVCTVDNPDGKKQVLITEPAPTLSSGH